MWLFSAAVFTMMKVNRGALKYAKAVKMQKINMTCKALGLDH